jgi:hypothetical protein
MKSLLVLCIVSVSSLAALSMGCAAPVSSASSSDEAASAGSVTASALVGSYYNDPGDSNQLPFWSYTFNADGTYSARGGCRQDTPTPEHCFAISGQTGTWQLEKSGSSTKLVLTSDFGDDPEVLFVTLRNDKLTLASSAHGKKSVFTLQVEAQPIDKDSLVGQYSEKSGSVTRFWGLTLNDDGTFDANGGCRPPGPTGAQCFALWHEHGTWTLQKSGPQLGAPGGAEQIVLTGDLGGDPDTYFISVGGDSIELSQTFRGKAAVFARQ